MTRDINIASDQDLMWLNNGFDTEATARLDAAYLDRARDSSPTPVHWHFPEEEGPGDVDEAAT